ncbi:MAG: ABC transporter ATP-binding protein [Deltaproteobacteria bacterium]|nr:ABC transporter ATP-binding protein [Deltaproteobacteria bacterium]
MASEALVTTGLSKRFGARHAVSDLSLSVRPGEVYGFLGPNGAGKTTAIRCMLGLTSLDAGNVQIFGESDPVDRLRNVGAMVETPAFHSFMSGRENLELAAAYSGVDIQAIFPALERVGLADRAEDKVGSYSLGMCQRLGLARAILGEPKLLILDEPTNGLDPRGMKDVRDLLTGLAEEKGTTVFVSSHLLAEVQQMCTRVGILDQGRLVSESSVEGDIEALYLATTSGSIQ